MKVNILCDGMGSEAEVCRLVRPGTQKDFCRTLPGCECCVLSHARGAKGTHQTQVIPYYSYSMPVLRVVTCAFQLSICSAQASCCQT